MIPTPESYNMNVPIKARCPKSHAVTIFLILLISMGLADVAVSAEPTTEPVDLVHPLIGSDWCREFFMTSAALPFGMVKLNPDTALTRKWKSGYQNAEPYVYGFSHLHEYKVCGLPVMPISGSVDPLSGPEGWKSPFDKQHQTVTPGYHRLTLTRYGIDAELTATMRVGMHRYTFNNSGNAEILVPLSGQWHVCTMRGVEVKRSAPDTIEGSVLTGRGTSAKKSFDTKVYFVIRADRPFDSLDGWKGKQLLKSIGNLQGDSKGGNCGLILNFGMIKGGTPIQLKVAISYCSVEGAHLNLKTELPGWDFAAVHAAARDTWNRALGRIEVTGSHDLEVKFYNGLWHALLGRGIFSDVDGHYPIYDGRGNKKTIKCVPLDSQGKPLFAMHNSDSFWWSQNNLNSVWGLAYPDVLRDFCLSWLQYYDDAGELPQGAFVGRVMHIMPGAQATPLLARAIQMNLSGVDPEHAYEAMKTQQTHNNSAMGKASVFAQYGGWMPADLDDWSVTHTVEDGWCDWVLSEVAKKLGKADDAVYFRRLSTGWTHLYNKDSGWLQPRNSNESWLKPFDVNKVKMKMSNHYKES